MALSPDGQTLVYHALENGISRLYRRTLDQLDIVPIPGTEGARNPFFSPDSQQVGFTLGTMLMRTGLAGGRPVRVSELPGLSHGASWGDDDTIIVASRGDAGLLRVLAAGGEPTSLVTRDGDRDYWFPQILPGGRAVLFTASYPAPDAGDVLVLDLDTGLQHTLVQGGVAGWFAPTGHLVFLREGDLWAIRFDLERLEVRGEAALVEQAISVESAGAVQFAVAGDGSLAYLPAGRGQRTLVWKDREGREEPIAALRQRAYAYPRVSPDGMRVAVDVRDQDNDIWVWDLARETLTQLTFDPANDWFPVWTPDNQRIVFASTRDGGVSNLFWVPADGTGTVQRLTDSPNVQYSYSVSPDGRQLVFREDVAQGARVIHVLPMEGESVSASLSETAFNQTNPEISPDGRWVAYQSDRSGRAEIYVLPFPDATGGLRRVSTDGGQRPVWAPDGRELFYHNGPNLMAVPVQTTSTLELGTPNVLFTDADLASIGLSGRSFDVGPDGRFLINKPAEPTAAADPDIIVVENWFEELKRLVPTE